MEFLNGYCSFFVVISGSGATAYVEPAAAVPLNNKLSEARADALKAEYEVLSKLTDKVTKLVNVLGSWFIVDLLVHYYPHDLLSYLRISLRVQTSIWCHCFNAILNSIVARERWPCST